MLDFDTTAAIVLVILITAFLIRKRDNLETHSLLFPLLYFSIYRTKLGLGTMDSIAKRWPRLVHWLAITGVIVGFAGMALIGVMLVKLTLAVIMTPGAPSPILPVLPIKAKGVFFIPFAYWIISIFVILIVHECSHGVVARRYGVPLLSSGLAALGVIVPIIPGAFVEPDERKLVKRKTMEQLGVFAAGPFANLVTAGLLILVIWGGVEPLLSSWYTVQGAEIGSIDPDSPAAIAGMQANELLISVNNKPVANVEEAIAEFKPLKAGETASLTTNTTTYSVIVGTKKGKPVYIGVSLRNKAQLTPTGSKYPQWFTHAIEWLTGLLITILELSVGVGLFNLLPLGPVDGGRMLKTALERFMDVKCAGKIWKFTGLFFLALIVIDLAINFIR